MANPDHGWKRTRLLHALAGLETGVLGGLAMLAWLVAGAQFFALPWWALPNLMASGFYGQAVFRGGPGMMTLAGAALHLVVAGSVGLVFGLLAPGSLSYLRLALLGACAGLAWYYLSTSPQWNKLSPLLPLHGPRSLLYSAHLLYGAMLALIRANHRKLTGTLAVEAERPSAA